MAKGCVRGKSSIQNRSSYKTGSATKGNEQSCGGNTHTNHHCLSYNASCSKKGNYKVESFKDRKQEFLKINEKRKKITYQDPFDLYLRLTSGGNNISLLMESRIISLNYGKQSIIVPDPAVMIRGKGNLFTIKALNKGGKRILASFDRKDFDYTGDYSQKPSLIEGRVKKERIRDATPEQRMRQKNLSSVIRTVLGKFSSGSPYAGLYGALSYDFARNFYSIKEMHGNEDDDFVLFIPSRVVVLDDIKHEAEIIEFCIGDNNIQSTPVTGFSLKQPFKQAAEPSSVAYDMSESEFESRVSDIIREIKAGRAIQCVFSRKEEVPLKKHPAESYSKLRERTPSPYSFYYNLGGGEILYGASPEMHITVSGRTIEIRPIAGTVKRSDNPLEDARARISLQTDEKELREHTMLVDLARHELYTLSEPTSLKINDLFSVEEYPNLYHLVSGIQAQLRDGVSAVDALLVTLPAGTLCGAPKMEAMRMIDEYEASSRGFYGGAVGLLSFNGDCNTGITIRSVHVKGQRSIVRAGAGIISLSDPSSELQETKLKMEKTLEVL